MEEQNSNQKAMKWIKNSLAVKAVIIGIIILVLLIPSKMIMNLIHERNQRKNEAVQEISSKWGGEQVVTGPVITIPYNGTIRQQTENGGSRTVPGTRYIYVLPDKLKINVELLPEIRYRGIYHAVLYKSVMNMSGEFIFPDLSSLGIEPGNILWNQAFLTLGIPDMRGITQSPEATVNNQKISFVPEMKNQDLFSTGLTAPIILDPAKKTSPISFTINLKLDGSDALRFIPFGKTTTVNMKSKWSDPGFEGYFLPGTRQVSADGFTASWEVLYMNRNFPQLFTDNKYSKIPENFLPDEIQNYSFGVSLLVPVDEYQKTSRSAKYNVLFILLTFLAFFFTELVNKNWIHPLQYLLVGCAVILFYVILLSLAEYLKFNLSYLVAGVSIIGMIGLYARSLFRSSRLGLLMAMILSILYSFFFIILQLQDYALLFGSIGLFLILAVIMYLSRNIHRQHENPETENLPSVKSEVSDESINQPIN